MIKNYSSLNSNTTLEFNKKSGGEITSGIYTTAIAKTSWFFIITMLLGVTIVEKAMANNTKDVVFNSSYTYHTVILKSFVAHGHSGGGGHGYAFFSPTDHDKPIGFREEITAKQKNKTLQYNNTNNSTNNKKTQS